MILFSEKQRFRQKWRWLLLLVPFAMNFLWNYQINNVFQLSFQLNCRLTSFVLIPILVIYSSFWIMSLKTEITTEGVSVWMDPFHLIPKFFSWQDIESIYIREYKPLWEEYDRWKLRSSFPETKGVIYYVSGTIVVQLEFKNNKKSFLIGTQRPEEVSIALQKAGKGQIENLK